uniref:Uncharacterized protein n=1 Tax=Anguilla anguilla TaxID=7936 RepID=A0A0E9QIB6_ANGAN
MSHSSAPAVYLNHSTHCLACSLAGPWAILLVAPPIILSRPTPVVCQAFIDSRRRFYCALANGTHWRAFCPGLLS